ncbi:MAG: hypothetical protein ACYC23_02815 [Limisphaerales bacterium]
MKKEAAENGCRRQPARESLYRLLEYVDAQLAVALQDQGCACCSEGKLHRANYGRKPRGGPERWTERHSFCCSEEGCRRRHTPPSVRFLGRKVYLGFVVVLKTAMRHGLSDWRVEQLRLALPDIDRRTLERWRRWWLENFAASAFWKMARARFIPPLSAEDLPLGLCERFGIESADRLVELLRFLAPITTISSGKNTGM